MRTSKITGMKTLQTIKEMVPLFIYIKDGAIVYSHKTNTLSFPENISFGVQNNSNNNN